MTTFSLLLLIVCLTAIECQQVNVKWHEVIRKSKTLPTLQVHGNPLYRRSSKIHKQVFKGLSALKASHLRIQFWLPYPRLVVAELEPPTKDTTSWNFTLMDPLMEDFMAAQNGRPVVMDFSTIPQWMFKTAGKVTYPDDPDQTFWTYTQGTELVDPSMKQLAEYYERLASWYIKGGFVDENGKQHTSGHNYTFDYWEVFNEIEAEHTTTPEQYTQRYDAIVEAVKKVSPKTKFVGLSLAFPDKAYDTYFPYFLNHSNHKKDIPLDAISYHFYGRTEPTDTVEQMQSKLFTQANQFFDIINKVETIRKALSPDTVTMLNEIGTLHEPPQGQTTPSIPKEYWSLSGAFFVYMYCGLALIGIEFAGESQLVGFPTQFPSVTMLDWDTGALNAKAIVLKLLIDNFGPGDDLLNTTISGTDAIHGMAFMTTNGHKKLLLINKRIEKIRVNLPEGAKQTSFTDVDNSDSIRTVVCQTDTLDLGGFAVHVIEF